MSVVIRKSVPIPLTEHATPTQFVSFHGFRDKKEHIAIVYGNANEEDAPLVRLHSECLTGDVFHSQRCDCGEQLAEAQSLMTQTGGILLYLRQEGRGIGLYNKIDAYELQDQGIDTYKANEMLGFGEDQRDFEPAAQMLHALSVKKVRLLSNNPRKSNALTDHGIEVIETLNTGVFANQFNEAYLKAKVDQHEHRLKLKK